MAGLHQHKCKCGNEWEHEYNPGVSSEAYKAAHTCTSCGADVRYAHFKTPADQQEYMNIKLENDPLLAFIMELEKVFHGR